jgi:GAF domain-containing protein
VFLPKAAYGMSEERVAWLRDRKIRLGETFLGRSATSRAPVNIADVQNDTSTPDAAELLPGIHAVLAVPLLREDEVIGGLVIRRRSEGGFEETTVRLLQTFAAQSVLAIANARLFDQLQARTKELTESLEIQSATADSAKGNQPIGVRSGLRSGYPGPLCSESLQREHRCDPVARWRPIPDFRNLRTLRGTLN